MFTPLRTGPLSAALTLLLAIALSLPLQAQEPQTDAVDDQDMTLNLQNADIGALIETVSRITGKNFIVDPRVQGKITIVSSAPTEAGDLYDLFLSVLRVHGFAAVEDGTSIKIVPDVNAKQNGIPTIVPGGALGNDAIATLVLELRNVSAQELVPVLRPLMPQSAHLAAHQDSNVLIAADSAGNLERLRRIVQRIDRDNNRAIEVIRLQYANAGDLVRVLQPTVQSAPAKGANGTAEELKLVADERTNSILLSGDRKGRLEIRALISHLDTPVDQQGDTEVIYLHYAVASELVEILQKLGGKLGLSETEQQKAADSQSAKDDPLFVIEADDNMNALVIHAPPKRIQAIKSVVRQLDVRRAQVLVEGIIAEVTYDKSIELGVQWQTSLGSDDTFAANRQPGTISGAIDEFTTDPLSLANGLTLGMFSGGDLRTLLRAIAGDTYSNILSTPTLMTMDNEEAEIVIGQNVPFVTGQYTNSTTTAANPFQTIERKDVGIVLKVKPQINEGDSVKLNIEQEISSIDQTTTANGADLITNKRSIKTNVLVDDGRIIVLGGLLEDDLQESVSKVPLLGDLPVLGHLFKNTRDAQVKTNLMIFLRPRIVRDARTGSQLTIDKYNIIRDYQRAQREEGVTLMPSAVPPELPPLPEADEAEARSRSEAGGYRPFGP